MKKATYRKHLVSISDIMKLMNFGHARAKKVFLEAKKISEIRVIDIYEKVPIESVLTVVGIRDYSLWYNQQAESRNYDNSPQ